MEATKTKETSEEMDSEKREGERTLTVNVIGDISSRTAPSMCLQEDWSHFLEMLLPGVCLIYFWLISGVLPYLSRDTRRKTN